MSRRGHVFFLPGLLLVLVALGGRYTLDRAGLTDLAWVDLRALGLAVGIALLVIDIVRRPSAPTIHRREGWLVVALLFFLYQIASGLWAPTTGRVWEKALDVALMAALTLAVYVYTLGDPATVLRWTFLFFYLAAGLFALNALLVTGPGVQGRYAAFGGGPNVFVRIEVLGVISAVALYRFHRRILVLLAIPLFLIAALLSGSRAGLLAAAVVGLIALVRVRGRLPVGPTLAAATVTVGAVMFVLTKAPSGVSSLIEDRFVQQTVEQGYTSGRTDIWTEAVRLAIDHPIIGTGLDGYYALIGRFEGVEYPHQYVLAVAAEGGLIGLVLLAASILLWIATIRRSSGHPAETLLAVSASAFVAISSLFSGDYYDARLAWLFAAMAAAAAVSVADSGTPWAPRAGQVGMQRALAASDAGDSAKPERLPGASAEPSRLPQRPRLQVRKAQA
jgi:O-antigen ligase